MERAAVKPRKYRTANGSTVTISGEHGGIVEVEFDWLEEPGACVDCRPFFDHGVLRWNCTEHESGSAALVEAM